MAITQENKKQLLAELLHIAEETREFDPPYNPSYYLQDVANSDPAELILRYVLVKDMTDGFARLWEENGGCGLGDSVEAMPAGFKRWR